MHVTVDVHNSPPSLDNKQKKKNRRKRTNRRIRMRIMSSRQDQDKKKKRKLNGLKIEENQRRKRSLSEVYAKLDMILFWMIQISKTIC